MSFSEGQSFLADWVYQPEQKVLSLSLRDADPALFSGLVPEFAAWHPAGRFDLEARLGPRQAKFDLALRDARFGDEAGLHAGEKISAKLAVEATFKNRVWQWQVDLDWPQGELYIAPVYRAGAMRAQARGRLSDQSLDIDFASLSLDGIGELKGGARWSRAGAWLLQEAKFHSGPLDLSTLVPVLVQPFIDVRAGPKVQATGTATFSAEIDGKGLRSLNAVLEKLNLESGRQALSGIEARIPWQRDTATQVRFDVAGGQFGELSIGPFSLPFSLKGDSVDLPRAEIPLLGSRLIFEDFHADRRNEAWQWRLGAALEPVAMPVLTEALGWPRMAGVFSAAIPRISYADATLSLDGQWMIAVFDGYLAVDGLKIIEPFGKLPRLLVNIEARHLDLGMLTHTFSFGEIKGYLDADIGGLEMSGLRPLAFDAHLRSTSGDYPKRISQRAVQNISALGGAGAAAAIQRSFLNLFETFGYERIGLHCRLENGVCLMGGVETPPNPSRLDQLAGKFGLPIPGMRSNLPANGYVIIQGGGLPSLNVIGYNHRVDWEELLARLKAAIASNGPIDVR